MSVWLFRGLPSYTIYVTGAGAMTRTGAMASHHHKLGSFPRPFVWGRQNIHFSLANSLFFEAVSGLSTHALPPLLELFELDIDTPECVHQLEEMEAVCPGAHIKALQADTADCIPSTPTAWLDDRKYGKKAKSRPYKCLLGARDLFAALRKKVRTLP